MKTYPDLYIDFIYLKKDNSGKFFISCSFENDLYKQCPYKEYYLPFDGDYKNWIHYPTYFDSEEKALKIYKLFIEMVDQNKIISEKLLNHQ